MDKRIIWIGLDVHAETITIARLDGNETTPKVSEIRNEPKAIARLFRALAAEGSVRAVYEAGACGYVLRRQLDELKVSCVVVAPSLIPRKPGDRIKTDRRDAIKLVKLLRAGELTAIHVPDEEQEAVRDVMRARDDTRKDRTAARQRLGKFLLRHGLRYERKSCWGKGHTKWLCSLRFERAHEQLVFEQYVAHVRQLDARIALFDEEIERLAKTPAFEQRVRRLCTLRGIQTLTAMVILSELYDLRRFDSANHLMAFVGLVAREHSSGSKKRRGAITKTGNGHVRRVLVEASWAYSRRPSPSNKQHELLVREPPEVGELARRATERLTKRYQRLVARRKPPQVAIVAVARELCGFIWAMEKLAA